MGAYTNKLTWEPLRSIDSATFTGSYQAVGTPLANPSYKLKMVNNSNKDVTVSIDGTNDIDVCPAGSFWLYDEGTVAASNFAPGVPAGTQIFVKGAAGTGSVYVVSQYVTRA